jgi:hypothetical protein
MVSTPALLLTSSFVRCSRSHSLSCLYKMFSESFLPSNIYHPFLIKCPNHLILTSIFFTILSTAIVLLTSIVLFCLFVRCSRSHSLYPSKYIYNSFLINYVNYFAELHIFCPTTVLLKLPDKTAILQHGVPPLTPPST